MKLCWLDVRTVADGLRRAIVEEAVHQRIDGIVAADPAVFDGLPPTVKKILVPAGKKLPESLAGIDIVIVDPAVHGHTAELAAKHKNVEFGRFVEIIDAETLEHACHAARTEKWSLLLFRDPTKIPLEIVLAAAAQAEGSIVTVAGDAEEAEIIFGVLEHGSDGVMMAPRAVGDATEPQGVRRRPGSRPGPGGAGDHRDQPRRHGRAGLRRHLHVLQRGRGDPGRLALEGHDPLRQRDPPAAVHADPPVPRERRRHHVVHAVEERPHELPERAGGRRQGARGRRQGPHPCGHGRPGEDRVPPAAVDGRGGARRNDRST